MTFLPHEVVFTTSWLELLAIAQFLTTITALIGAYRHVECRISGCHRLGRFVWRQYRLCHIHHPQVPSSGRITPDLLSG